MSSLLFSVLIEAAEKLTDLIFGGRVLWGPSVEMIARKRAGDSMVTIVLKEIM